MRVFTEEQRFNQWWLHLILIIEFIFVGFTAYTGWSDNIKENLILGGALLLIPVIHLLIYALSLTTRVDEFGISFKFKPFISKNIKWNEINEVYVRKYSPLGEYGGWGIRFTFNGNGRAYNIKGDIGLQLVLKNGKRILIGTQKESELKQVLTKINKK